MAATLNGTADFINDYSYDTLSRLRDITQQGQTGGNAVAPKSIYIGLDGVGDITTLNYANTVTAGPQPTNPGDVTLTYSPTTGLLTNINNTANGTSIDNLAYTYDALGRVSTFTSIDGTATYGYDNTSQLVSAAYTTATGGHQPANVNFTWDANGNNAAPGNVVSPNNEVTNDGTYTYTFDADGNRTSRAAISSASSPDHKTTYTWDYRDRLTDVEFFDNNNVLTKHVHYVYGVYDNLLEEDIDPTGGGAYTTKEQFVLDVKAIAPTAGNAPLETFDASGDLTPLLPDDVLMELVNNQLTERFLNGPSPSGAADVIYAEGAVASLAQPDSVDWIFANYQGSPTDIVNSSGALIDHEVYSPFGQVAYVSNAGVFVLQGFSGGFADPNTGLIKFGERWYDPLATVWISVDPTGFRAGDANLGRYVGNSPTADVDPTGQAEKEHNIVVGDWPYNKQHWTLPDGTAPTNQWFKTDSREPGYAWKDKDSGFTFFIKLVKVCINGANVTRASGFIVDNKGTVIGQMLLTQPPDKNGKIPPGSWVFLPVGGDGEESGQIKVNGSSDDGVVEVSKSFGTFLKNVEIELALGIKLQGDNGGLKPSIDGGSICVGLKYGVPDNSERDLQTWYNITKNWYDQLKNKNTNALPD